VRARAIRARLVHDVGKYVARTARNLPPGPVDAELVAMLARDLFGSEREARASARLDAIVAGDALAGHAAIASVRALLAEADDLEAPLRAGEAQAVARAAALALDVERLLRALVAEAAS
jgi:hypothetical protein